LRETGASSCPAARFSVGATGGAAAQTWQEREAQKPLPGTQAAPILYLSADATGVPMRPEELEGRAGKQPDGTAKTARLSGCAFTQHKRMKRAAPCATMNHHLCSKLGPLEDFGSVLRQEAIRRGLAKQEKWFCS